MEDSPNTKFIISELHATEDLTTTIELGECEDKLKANKSLSQNDSLFVLYIEIDENGMDVPRTEYEIYSKSGDGDLDNVDLDICQDMKINKSVSINITQDEIDKYNSSSGYYNDICYTYTSDNGTDVTLADRRNEYIDNNMAVCEDKCEFIAYDLGTGKAICSCPLVAKVSNISDNKIDIDKLKSNFINFKNIANVKILKCYHLLFSKKIFKNIGCIIISLIIILALGSLFLFYFYGYNLLSHKIKDIVNVKSLETKEDKKEKNDQKNSKRKSGPIIYSNNTKENLVKDEHKNEMKKSKKNKRRKSSLKSKSQKEPPKKSLRRNTYIKQNDFNNNVQKKRNSEFNKRPNSLENFISNEEKISIHIIEEKDEKEIMKLNDTEINLLLYHEAQELDKRSYFEYYKSLVKTRHLLFFSFFYNKDYNSKIIKINLFFFTFTVNYTVNALFFNDSTMHQIMKMEENLISFIKFLKYYIPH